MMVNFRLVRMHFGNNNKKITKKSNCQFLAFQKDYTGGSKTPDPL